MKKRLGSVLGRHKAMAMITVLVLACSLFGCRQKARNEKMPTAAPSTAASTRPIPRKDAFFGMHFDLHPNAQDTSLGADISRENIAALLERVHPDYVQYDCKGHPGYAGYPTKVGWPSPGIVRDSLAVWRQVTREHGVGLYIHYSGVWDSKAIEEHPDWARVDAKGQRDRNATSVFGPYVDKLLIPQLEEVTSAYDLDGAWVDGECWAAQLDYSPAAQQAWRQQTGYSTAPKDRADPHWLEWKMFHRQAFENYLCRWVDTLHAFNPKLQLTSNWMYTSFAPLPIRAKLDFLSGDYSPSLSVDRARVEARYLASTGMPWDLMAWGFDRGREQDWSLKTPVHLMQEAAVVLMQGGGFEVYNVPTRSGYIIPAIIHQVALVADFCRERQALSHKSLTVPQVALLNSETSLWDRMDRLFSAAGELDELEGALQALLDLHYSVDILAEHQLISRLNDFPLVVIPDSHKLAPDFQQALIRYVENGGSLLLLGENCARLFESLLGVRLIGEPKKTAAELATPLGPVSVGGIWQTVEPAAADSAGLRCPTRDFRRDSETAATIATRGRGKIAAVYGPVALAFFRGHHPGLRLFIGELVSRIFADPLVKIDASPALDIALRRTSDGRLSLHLLNRSAFPVPDRYNFIDSVPSVGPVKVSLKLEARPKNVLWLPSGQAVSWVYENGRLQANIPSVHIHGILLVD